MTLPLQGKQFPSADTDTGVRHDVFSLSPLGVTLNAAECLLHHANCVVTTQDLTFAEASISILLPIGPRLFVSSPGVCHHRLQDEALLLTIVVGRQCSSLSETPRPAHPIRSHLSFLKRFDRLRVHSRLAPTCIASGHRFLISKRSRSCIVGFITTSCSF